MQNLLSRLVGISLLVATAPTMALIAMVLWLESRGPIFHRYMRIDQSGGTFEAWCFNIYRLAQPNEASATQHLTAIGRVLWWARLDQLPIVINLACGTARIAFAKTSRPGTNRRLEITIVAGQ
jgi:lipopolysaccharide/colanic/teichoic acid biosynthesis glycosyltransferase